MNNALVVVPSRGEGSAWSSKSSFDETDEFRGSLKGFREFVKPHLNKIVQRETKKLKGGKCSHADCIETATDFGHWPWDVDTILEVMLEDYRMEGRYRYIVPLKEFCIKYALMHRGENGSKVGRPVCHPCNLRDNRVIKAKLTYQGT
ncbi:hypothetical protein [Microvirga aerophila]|uniref:Uncharacterized protein n=1 Tax=Microvirga aerophila TaxID=670291 RepID=A0A512C4M5_9HYPH|nr:hypothetical protein [Microvirga aerophila]GEO19120.1 hypothetical protein MAE02_68160 [Microvirga aerophila]